MKNRIAFICDYGRNLKCSKTNCGYIHTDGCCFRTMDVEYAKNFGKLGTGYYEEKIRGTAIYKPAKKKSIKPLPPVYEGEDKEKTIRKRDEGTLKEERQ